MHLRPMILAASAARETCATCDARHSSVCDAVADTELQLLADIAVQIKVERGHIFIEEGDGASDFYNVTSGTVKIFKLLPDGRQQITGFAGFGHFLGLAVSDSYAFSAEAVDDVRLCRYPRAKLRRLLDDVPLLEKRLLETACNELATAQDQMLLLGRKTAIERVASFLVNWSRDSVPCPVKDHVRLPMSRGEIADYLGLTIETVSRTFTRLRLEKRISTPSNNEVVLLDRRWLTHVAAGAS